MVEANLERHARWVLAKQLAKFLGIAVSCQLAVPPSQLYLR